MRITSANIPAPVGKAAAPSTPYATDKTTPGHQTADTRDSYRKNSSPQIIDAEYVEFYSPSIKHFNQERQSLDNTLEPADSHPQVDNSGRSMSTDPLLQKYALKAHEAPPPGSYIDTFA